MQIMKARRGITGMILLLCIVVTMMFTGQTVFAAGQSATIQTVSSGEALKNGWQADGTYYRNNVMLKGVQRINGKLYDLDQKTGRKHVNSYKKYKGKLYHFGRKGVGTLYTGNYKGKRYKSGKLFSGVYKGYYYRKGVKQTGYKSVVKKMDNGKVYYFQKSGKVYKGTAWKRIKGQRYHFRKGIADTGWKYVGEYKYYFNKNGTLCQDLIAKFGEKWKKKSIFIKVNRKKNCITLFAKDGKKGYTIPVKAFPCSVGKASTPTVKGTYTLTKSRTYRWAKLGGPTMGGYSYGQYCTRITGSYLFHSVMYRTASNRALNAAAYNQLGSAASHGCIRLEAVNAKLIYDIVRNKDTKVTIYDSDKIGPFDKPKAKKVPASQHYDPTDPNIKK